MKKYKAIFFDWDGTAVVSRDSPADPVIEPMKTLLQKGVPLIIISGTTYDRIAGGSLESYFTSEELQHLFLGLGRGVFNYRFDSIGRPVIWKDLIPDMKTLLKIHEICFIIHQRLLEDYYFHTDIVFTRPNYCKIDLMVENDRGGQLFMQSGEMETLKTLLADHGIRGGLPDLIRLSREISGSYGLNLSVTCDAKYLEVGLSDKSNNINDILSLLRKECNILPEDCCYWGDEYVGLDEKVFGSDSFMMTEASKTGDFFDVSETEGPRPEGVVHLGGGVQTFWEFLKNQA